MNDTPRTDQTPRTDAACYKSGTRIAVNNDSSVVSADFARTLERELAAALADKERLDWLSELLVALPHVIVAHNDDPDVECDETPDGLAPVGFRISTDGCQGVRIDVAPTLRAAIDASRKEQP